MIFSRPTTTSRVLAALLVAATLATGCGSAAADEPVPVRDRVTVAQGELRGTDDGRVARFQAIPYAAPPVDGLRLAPPQDPGPWAGIREATAPGPVCLQLPTPQRPVPSEDCLTLAVSTPSGSTQASKHPVLVWIHGGGFREGAGSDYDPRALVTEGGLVVVTINYRLGALGFMGLPGVEGSGAFGLLDQQAALRWVRANISAFGGDPGNVTIAGESAGADSVCSQLGAPTAVGLFHRAIMQSGSCHATNVTDAILLGLGVRLGQAVDIWKPRELVDGAGTTLAQSLGCTDPAVALDCLRALPPDRIAAAPTTTFWSPAIGTRTLPRRPSDALAVGEVPDLPVLTGVNDDEGALFAQAFFGGAPLDEKGVRDGLGLAAGDRAAEAVAAYALPDRIPNRVWADVISDRAYACPNLAADETMSAGAPVFAYDFADPGAPSPFAVIPPEMAGGATHAAELPYLFGLTGTGTDVSLTGAQQRLAAQMRGYWARFAATGDPNGSDPNGSDLNGSDLNGSDLNGSDLNGSDPTAAGPHWPRFGADGPLLTLTSEGSAVTTATAYAQEHRCAIWN